MRSACLLSLLLYACGDAQETERVDAGAVSDTAALDDGAPAIDLAVAVDLAEAVDSSEAVDLAEAIDLAAAVDTALNDETMEPGQDCIACHKTFSLGGTVYGSATSPLDQGLADVTITIVDSADMRLKLTSNQVGNFYGKAPVVWPADITFTLGERTATMIAARSGACNTCHTTNRQSLMFIK